MNRRAFISISGSLLLAGCTSLGSGVLEDSPPIAEQFNCDSADRPEPDVEPGVEFDVNIEGDSVSFTSAGGTGYPSPPESLNGESIRSFLADHEVAYLRNEFVEQYGRGLVGFDTSIDAVTINDRHEGSVLARVDYYEEHEIVTEDGNCAIGEGPAGAAYVIDETGLLRAETRHRDVRDSDTSLREATPNPLEEGQLVACY